MCVCVCVCVFSPTGSHVEWCKQLIAATISSQISGTVPPELVNRDNKVVNSCTHTHTHTHTHTVLTVILIRWCFVTDRLEGEQI